MMDTDFSRYFSDLHLSVDATFEEVKQAFRQLSKAGHPDQFISDKRKYDQAVERQKRINAAYSILCKEFRNGTLPLPIATESGARRRTETQQTKSDANRTQQAASSKAYQPSQSGIGNRLLDELLERGRTYERGGLNDPVDIKNAVACYKQAGRMGSPVAYFRLGLIYLKGSENDIHLALEHFEKAANLGHVGGAFNVALMYERGQGTRRDIKKALSYYREAAARGDVESKRRVQSLLERIGQSAAATAPLSFSQSRSPSP